MKKRVAFLLACLMLVTVPMTALAASASEEADVQETLQDEGEEIIVLEDEPAVELVQDEAAPDLSDQEISEEPLVLEEEGDEFELPEDEMTTQASPSLVKEGKYGDRYYPITLHDCSITNPKKVQFAVWTETKGQDDLVWYDAAKQSDGTYRIRVDVLKHKHAGKFIVHAYAVNSAGNKVFQASKVFRSFPKITGVVAGESVSGKQTQFPVYVYNLKNVFPMKEITFGVWSDKKGQDDLVWYPATRIGSGANYEAKVAVANHKNLGLFHVHAYLKMKNGDMVYLGQTTFTADEPSGKITINNVDGNKGKFGIIAHQLKPSGSAIKKIEFAVWTQDDGQDDLKWYTGKKEEDGNYTYILDVRQHKCEFGKYVVHGYMTLESGTRKCFATKTVTINPDNFIYVVTSGKKEATVHILGADPADSYEFPTWSTTNGQDDLVWYSGSKVDTNHYKAVVRRANHSHDGGYITDVYKVVGTTKTKMGRKTYELKSPYKIAIDPGHQQNGDSTTEPLGPGSTTMKAKCTTGSRGVSTKVMEYALTLTVALKLQTELQNRGYDVYMTRTANNVKISNATRAKNASASGANIYIRLHANDAGTATGTRGAIAMITSASNKWTASQYTKNKKLANCILTKYCASTKFTNRGVSETDQMTGNNWSTIPTVILEMGFLSNAAEDAAMNNASTQNLMVKGIANGIDDYFK